MLKIMIHIKNDYTDLDKNVSALIELPAVPRKGDDIYFDDDVIQTLEDEARSSLEIARAYAPKWFYSNSDINPEKLKQEDLKDIYFSDAIYIHSVHFFANSEIIHITMCDSYQLDED